jgi:hypothetical protein
MCARTGNRPKGLDLRQDPAPRLEEAEETESPTLCEGTPSVVPEAPTCDMPTNDESFRPTLDCSTGAVVLQGMGKGAGQSPVNRGSPAGADLGGLRSENSADKPDDIPPTGVTAADADDDDHEATVSNDERALDLIDQGTAPANSPSNFSQITGDEPASGLVRDGPLKTMHTRHSVSATIPVPQSSTSASGTHARHNQAGRTCKRRD